MAAVESIVSQTSSSVEWAPVRYVRGYHPAHTKPYSEIALGSTAHIWRHELPPGVIIKAPHSHEDLLDLSLQNKYCTEAAILQSLGSHSRTVKFLGLLNPPLPHKGLLLAEAPNGDVSTYLTTHGVTIDIPMRLKWCKQAAEGLAHCHAHGVLHCDLRPDNMLLDYKLDLSICDFGGSKNAQYYGGGLPDTGFCNPKDEWSEVTEATEVFGLGSCMYTFMTGLIPHGSSAYTARESFGYDEKFARLLNQGEYPNTTSLAGGGLIHQCWTGRIISASDVYSSYINLERQRDEQEPGSS